MSTATELILFVPGLSGAEAEAYLDKFVTGFAEHAKSSAMNTGHGRCAFSLLESPILEFAKLYKFYYFNPSIFK